MVIRARTNEDIDALLVALTSLHHTDGYPVHLPRNPASFVLASDPYGAWVAEEDGEVVGHVTLRRPGDLMPVRLWCQASGEDPDSCAVVARLFVVARFQRRGIGQALLAEACTMAAELNLRAVLDVAESTGLTAMRMYRRLGWVHCGTYEARFYEGGPTEVLHCFAAPNGVGVS